MPYVDYEYGLQQKREYYYKNRERILSNIKARREENLDKSREYEREVYSRRREKVQATNRARERKLENPTGETVEYISILKGDPCSYCGGTMEQIDHIEPVSLGGGNQWDNLTAACWKCNRSKSNKTLLEHFSPSGN